MSAPFTITPRAFERVRGLLQERSRPAMGVRIGVRARGCSGLSYTMEYAESVTSGDSCVEQDGLNIFIEPKAMLYIVGTEMDYVESPAHSGFVFNNPNEKGRCGCGQSFHI
jgi:iron-sulfur cluster assembly protein